MMYLSGMVEAVIMAELFLDRNVTCKLLKQNYKTKLGSNECTTENIAIKVNIFIKIYVMDCKGLHGSKQDILYYCSLLKARSKVISQSHFKIFESPELINQ